MRLSKSSLVAAACVLTSLVARAQSTVTILGPTLEVTDDTTLFNPAGGGTIAISSEQTLTIVSDFATTLNAAFIENGTTDLANLRVINGTVFKVNADTGEITGGNVVKEGGGVLQINAWTGLSGTQRTAPWWVDADGTLGFDYPFTGFSWLAGGPSPVNLQPQITQLGNLLADGRNGSRLNGLQGSFTVNQGTVRLAGFLNVWHDQGANDILDLRPLFGPPARVIAEINEVAIGDPFAVDPDALEAYLIASQPLARRMTGVAGIILNGSSVLELTNSPLLIPTGNSNTVTQGNALRVQYLRNLQAGLANDQFQTELSVGTTAEYRALVHIDQGFEGSIGILSGAGSVVKSGAGSFTILNESRLTGSFTVSGGTVILDSAGGRALATAASVNIASTGDDADRGGAIAVLGGTNLSLRGANVRYLFDRIDTNGDGALENRYKPAYAPDTGTNLLTLNEETGFWEETRSGGVLRLANDQTIRNFQSDFAYAAAPDETGTAESAIRRAADVTNRGELVIAGTGFGSTLDLGGNTLTIRQDARRDGFYEGRFEGGFDFGGVFTPIGTPGAPAYELSFERLPGFGTCQLSVTGADGVRRLTGSILLGDTDDLRASLASALDLPESRITVTDISGEAGVALAYRVTLDDSVATLDDMGGYLAGKVILDGTSPEARLALILAGGSSVAEIETRSGSLIVNAQALGSQRVNTAAGEIRIFQTDAASLEATLLGGGIVRVVGRASVDNGSGSLIEINPDEARGTLNFALQQRRFTGELIVTDGINVSLSSDIGDINDTLLNARAITLDSSGSTLGSILRFNDTNQTVRNLSGDALSAIELGRGTMTLVQSDASRRFLGNINGVGSVIKRGAANFEFRGAGSTDFYGAAVVQQGAISAGSADALRKTSG
ncbi:MAG: hypothetical protein ACK5VI_09890, partial [Opitutia bacterium]